MALVTANGLPVLTMSLTTPRTGAWHADLYVDPATGSAPVDPAAVLTGPITIDVGDGATVLTGTVAPGRSGIFLDVNQLRVVGGAGGLGLTAKPRRYRSASIGIVLRDLLTAAGETIDPAADQTVLNAPVADWTVRAVPVGAAIGELFAAYAPAGAAWRVTLAGVVWAGIETWPDIASSLPVDAFQLSDNDDETRTVKLLLDQPTPLVATTFQGDRVSLVHFYVSGAEAEPVQAELWFEPTDGAGDVDRMKAALFAIVRAVPAGLSRLARFWANVVQQSGTKVHAQPADTGLPDMGEVELAMPPGDTVEGVTGGRVLVGFTGRDGAAVAHGFQGSTPATRTLNVSGTLNLGGPNGASAVNGEALMTYLTALATAAGGPAPDPTTLLAKKTKVT